MSKFKKNDIVEFHSDAIILNSHIHWRGKPLIVLEVMPNPHIHNAHKYKVRPVHEPEEEGATAMDAGLTIYRMNIEKSIAEMKVL